MKKDLKSWTLKSATLPEHCCYDRLRYFQMSLWTPDFGKAEIHHFLTKNIPVLHGAKVFSSTNGARTGMHMQKKKMNLEADLAPFIEINSKWIIDVNVKRKTIKLLEGNIRENPRCSDAF